LHSTDENFLAALVTSHVSATLKFSFVNWILFFMHGWSIILKLISHAFLIQK